VALPCRPLRGWEMGIQLTRGCARKASFHPAFMFTPASQVEIYHTTSGCTLSDFDEGAATESRPDNESLTMRVCAMLRDDLMRTAFLPNSVTRRVIS
jgi:hypothetical protein